MALERVSCSSSLIDLLDRILDKGLVVDAGARILLAGIDLAASEARVVVDSMDVAGFGGITDRSSTPAHHVNGPILAEPTGRGRRKRK